MTGQLYIRPANYLRWCVLSVPGGESHATACGSRLGANELVLVTTTPDAGKVCAACSELMIARDFAGYRVTLSPGVEASLRVTDDGRVRMIVPGGDLDVTDGGALLGSGLHAATARAAQIRAQLEARRAARASRMSRRTR